MTEHRPDAITTADWLIGMELEARAGGGQWVGAGTPEDIAANPCSHYQLR